MPTPPPAPAAMSASTSRASSSSWRQRLEPERASTSRSSCSTMRPRSNTMTSSTIRSVDSLWAMMNVVRPSMSWATAASSRCSVTGSMRAVASSSTTRSGWRSQTRASASSCDSPADSPAPPAPRLRWMPASASDARPARDSASITSSSVGVSSNSVTLSRIVPSNSSTSWGTSATRRRSSAQRHVADRHPAQRHRARRRIDEPQQQPRERGLAAAGAADDTDRSSGRDVEVEALEHDLLVRARSVRERHVAALHGERARRRRRRAAVEERRLDGQQVDDAHHRPIGLLHRLELVHEVLQRAGDDQHVLEQQEAGAERDGALADERRAGDRAR